MKQGETLGYMHVEHLGSSSVVTGSDGTLHSAMFYLPFGETRFAIATLPTERQFTGQRFDGGSGLYFYNARYYDAALGRFISPDPIVPEPGNPQAFNRYSYVLNNPLKYTDPDGTTPCLSDLECATRGVAIYAAAARESTYSS